MSDTIRMRKKIIFSLVVVACLAAIGLYFRPDPGTLQHLISGKQANVSGEAAKGGKPGAGGVRSTSILSATATTADFPVRRYAIGFVASPAVVNVNGRISSQIVSIAVKDGQMVKAGDLLFSLDDRALQAQLAKDQATLAKDQALLVSATEDLKRAQDLVNKQAGTRQTYDLALAAQRASAANVEADKATIEADTVQLSYATISAPISGRLGAVNVSEGDLVTTNGNGTSAPLVTITQIDPLEVSFTLPESDFALLQKALASPQQGGVTLRSGGALTPIGKGTLDFVDSTIDTASGTIDARASVPNPDLSLWPGQYVSVVLDAGTMPQMTSVPTVAVQPSQKGPFVYVVKPDDTVEMRPVQVALTEGENSAISHGLKAGEKVVVEGQSSLKDGAAVHEAEALTASGEPNAPKAPEAGKTGEAGQ